MDNYEIEALKKENQKLQDQVLFYKNAVINAHDEVKNYRVKETIKTLTTYITTITKELLVKKKALENLISEHENLKFEYEKDRKQLQSEIDGYKFQLKQFDGIQNEVDDLKRKLHSETLKLSKPVEVIEYILNKTDLNETDIVTAKRNVLRCHKNGSRMKVRRSPKKNKSEIDSTEDIELKSTFVRRKKTEDVSADFGKLQNSSVSQPVDTVGGVVNSICSKKPVKNRDSNIIQSSDLLSVSKSVETSRINDTDEQNHPTNDLLVSSCGMPIIVSVSRAYINNDQYVHPSFNVIGDETTTAPETITLFSVNSDRVHLQNNIDADDKYEGNNDTGDSDVVFVEMISDENKHDNKVVVTNVNIDTSQSKTDISTSCSVSISNDDKQCYGNNSNDDDFLHSPSLDNSSSVKKSSALNNIDISPNIQINKYSAAKNMSNANKNLTTDLGKTCIADDESSTNGRFVSISQSLIVNNNNNMSSNVSNDSTTEEINTVAEDNDFINKFFASDVAECEELIEMEEYNDDDDDDDTNVEATEDDLLNFTEYTANSTLSNNIIVIECDNISDSEDTVEIDDGVLHGATLSAICEQENGYDDCKNENIDCLNENIDYLNENIDCLNENIDCLNENIDCLNENIDCNSYNSIEYVEEIDEDSIIVNDNDVDDFIMDADDNSISQLDIIDDPAKNNLETSPPNIIVNNNVQLFDEAETFNKNSLESKIVDVNEETPIIFQLNENKNNCKSLKSAAAKEVVIITDLKIVKDFKIVIGDCFNEINSGEISTNSSNIYNETTEVFNNNNNVVEEEHKYSFKPTDKESCCHHLTTDFSALVSNFFGDNLVKPISPIRENVVTDDYYFGVENIDDDQKSPSVEKKMSYDDSDTSKEIVRRESNLDFISEECASLVDDDPNVTTDQLLDNFDDGTIKNTGLTKNTSLECNNLIINGQNSAEEKLVGPAPDVTDENRDLIVEKSEFAVKELLLLKCDSIEAFGADKDLNLLDVSSKQTGKICSSEGISMEININNNLIINRSHIESVKSPLCVRPNEQEEENRSIERIIVGDQQNERSYFRHDYNDLNTEKEFLSLNCETAKEFTDTDNCSVQANNEEFLTTYDDDTFAKNLKSSGTGSYDRVVCSEKLRDNANSNEDIRDINELIITANPSKSPPFGSDSYQGEIPLTDKLNEAEPISIFDPLPLFEMNDQYRNHAENVDEELFSSYSDDETEEDGILPDIIHKDEELLCGKNFHNNNNSNSIVHYCDNTEYKEFSSGNKDNLQTNNEKLFSPAADNIYAENYRFNENRNFICNKKSYENVDCDENKCNVDDFTSNKSITNSNPRSNSSYINDCYKTEISPNDKLDQTEPISIFDPSLFSDIQLTSDRYQSEVFNCISHKTHITDTEATSTWSISDDDDDDIIEKISDNCKRKGTERALYNELVSRNDVNDNDTNITLERSTIENTKPICDPLSSCDFVDNKILQKNEVSSLMSCNKRVDNMYVEATSFSNDAKIDVFSKDRKKLKNVRRNSKIRALFDNNDDCPKLIIDDESYLDKKNLNDPNVDNKFNVTSTSDTQYKNENDAGNIAKNSPKINSDTASFVSERFCPDIAHGPAKIPNGNKFKNIGTTTNALFTGFRDRFINHRNDKQFSPFSSEFDKEEDRCKLNGGVDFNKNLDSDEHSDSFRTNSRVSDNDVFKKQSYSRDVVNHRKCLNTKGDIKKPKKKLRNSKKHAQSFAQALKTYKHLRLQNKTKINDCCSLVEMHENRNSSDMVENNKFVSNEHPEKVYENNRDNVSGSNKNCDGLKYHAFIATNNNHVSAEGLVKLPLYRNNIVFDDKNKINSSDNSLVHDGLFKKLQTDEKNIFDNLLVDDVCKKTVNDYVVNENTTIDSCVRFRYPSPMDSSYNKLSVDTTTKKQSELVANRNFEDDETFNNLVVDEQDVSELLAVNEISNCPLSESRFVSVNDTSLLQTKYDDSDKLSTKTVANNVKQIESDAIINKCKKRRRDCFINLRRSLCEKRRKINNKQSGDKNDGQFVKKTDSISELLEKIDSELFGPSVRFPVTILRESHVDDIRLSISGNNRELIISPGLKLISQYESDEEYSGGSNNDDGDESTNGLNRLEEITVGDSIESNHLSQQASLRLRSNYSSRPTTNLLHDHSDVADANSQNKSMKDDRNNNNNGTSSARKNKPNSFNEYSNAKVNRVDEQTKSSDESDKLLPRNLKQNDCRNLTGDVDSNKRRILRTNRNKKNRHSVKSVDNQSELTDNQNNEYFNVKSLLKQIGNQNNDTTRNNNRNVVNDSRVKSSNDSGSNINTDVIDVKMNDSCNISTNNNDVSLEETSGSNFEPSISIPANRKNNDKTVCRKVSEVPRQNSMSKSESIEQKNVDVETCFDKWRLDIKDASGWTIDRHNNAITKSGVNSISKPLTRQKFRKINNAVKLNNNVTRPREKCKLNTGLQYNKSALLLNECNGKGDNGGYYNNADNSSIVKNKSGYWNSEDNLDYDTSWKTKYLKRSYRMDNKLRCNAISRNELNCRIFYKKYRPVGTAEITNADDKEVPTFQVNNKHLLPEYDQTAMAALVPVLRKINNSYSIPHLNSETIADIRNTLRSVIQHSH